MHSKKLADMAGVSVRTLRHYHTIGLLPEPPRQDNGYREYDFDDLARVLRIKRLSFLGFSLERVGEVLDELDASTPAAPTTGGALDDLDRELTAQIERLKEQRRTIALLKQEQISPDFPIRFAQMMKVFGGAEDNNTVLSEEDRTLLLLASNLYDDDSLDELELVLSAMQEQGLTEAAIDLDQRVEALPEHASEQEREALVSKALELFDPLLDAFAASNWDRPYTPSELLLLDLQSSTFNEAQNEVLNRIHRALEERIIARAAAQGDRAHDPSTNSAPSLDPDVAS